MVPTNLFVILSEYDLDLREVSLPKKRTVIVRIRTDA
jgi:hypothetical protein